MNRWGWRGALASSIILVGCQETVDCDAISLVSHDGPISSLQWSTQNEAVTSVQFSAVGAEPANTECLPGVESDEGSQNHEHFLVGIPENTEVEYVATTHLDGEAQSCEGSFVTGVWSDNMPEYEVTFVDSDADMAPFILMANAGYGRSHVVLLNRQGDVLWTMGADDRTIVTQVVFDVDGPGLIYLAQDASRESEELSTLVTGSWSQEELERQTVVGAHHKFDQLDDGSLVFIATDIRDWIDPESGETESVVGDKLLILKPDGVLEEFVSVWDLMEVEKHGRWQIEYFPDKKDWTHGNGIDYDADRNSYMWSLANLDAVIELDADSGEVLSMFGEDYSGFSEDSDVFNYQHDAKWTENGTITMTTVEGYTYALEYEVDAATGELHEIWSYGYGERIFSPILGEVHLLANGNRVVVWGTGALVQELDPDGELIWELTGNTGKDMYSSVRMVRDLYAGR